MTSGKTGKVSPQDELARKEKLLAFEVIRWAEGFSFVAGVDEAGRGCMAGPVVAAAVIFTDPDKIPPGIHDSKQMTEKARETLRPIIEREAIAWAVEEVSAEEIDTINILNASITGMQRAVRKLEVKPEYLLIDGNKFKPFDGYQYQCVVKGDGKFASIAAASVLAKTYRDEYMRKLAQEYPQYGWERNMGYPTKEHIQAIIEHGYTPHHRKSFHLKQLEPTLF